MKLLSDAAEYGLRAVVWLAKCPGGACTAEEIARHTRCAGGYLVRVLQQLRQADIVHAKRGAGGGFTLSRDPARIALLDVLNAVDPIQRIRTCPLGLAEHSFRLCGLHREIDGLLQHMEQVFGGMTVAELIDERRDVKPLCEPLPIKVRVA